LGFVGFAFGGRSGVASGVVGDGVAKEEGGVEGESEIIEVVELFFLNQEVLSQLYAK